MCGRFTVTAKDTKTIADRFQVELEKALERESGEGKAPPASKERAEKLAKGLGRFNVAPTQEILTVRSSPDPEEAAAGRARGAADALGPGAALGQGPQVGSDDQRQSREPDQQPAYGTAGRKSATAA